LRVLFDHNVDRRFRRHLTGHEIRTAREMRWETLTNGVLLATAAAAGYEALLSLDKKLRHEQNLATLPLPVVILDSVSNALPQVLPFAPFVLELFTAPLDRRMYVIAPDGTVSVL
jgi:hypothetical protein